MNRRDFLKAAGATMASAALPKLPKIETAQDDSRKRDEPDKIFEYTEDEEQLMYRFCECGEKNMRLQNDAVICARCGKSQQGDIEDLVYASILGFLQQGEGKFLISLSSPHTPTTDAVRLAQWEKFRAYHMVHGTFDENAQLAYKAHKRMYSDV